jgi:hypothetical protein
VFGELNPLLTGIVVFAVLAASIVIVVSLALSHRGAHPRQPVIALPTGADAALWSIVEAVPDPRNHLALTRDLSGEVHITSADREAAAALYSERQTTQRIAAMFDSGGTVKTRPAPAPERRPVQAPRPEVGAETSPRPQPVDTPIVARDDIEPEPESDADKLVRTSEFFFAGEPRLNRF